MISFAVNPAIGSEPLSAWINTYNHTYSNIRWYIDGNLVSTGTESIFETNVQCNDPVDVTVEIDLDCGLTVSKTEPFEHWCSGYRMASSYKVYPNPTSETLLIQPGTIEENSAMKSSSTSKTEFTAMLLNEKGKVLSKIKSKDGQGSFDTREIPN